jgi:hypothetical protein
MVRDRQERANMWEFILGQVAALATFFAFPALQYILLKRYARSEGRPELWFLPQWGFRLVIHNITGQKKLSEIHYRAMLRHTILAGEGSSVNTYEDHILHEREEFFLFPNTDQVLLSFKVELAAEGLVLIHTDKLGKELNRFLVTKSHKLIVDYTANIENFFNFDVRLARRVQLSGTLIDKLKNPGAEEKEFELNDIVEI